MLRISLLGGALLVAGILTPTAATQARTLTTLFTSDNGRTTPDPTSMFDITVLNPAGVRIVALDVNSSGTAGVQQDIEVYVTPGSYVGNELTPSAWLRAATGTGVCAGSNLATSIDTSDFVLPAGTYGLAVHFVNNGTRYTNGTGTNQSYGNTDLSLQLGATTASLFTGTLFTPRVWNGTIYYATPTDATHGSLGEGCQGSNGVPTLAAAPGSWPKIGTTFMLDVSNLPASPGFAFILFGFDTQMWAGSPLPFDLSVIGMTGCSLYVDYIAVYGFAVIGGMASFPVPVPNDSTLLGAPFMSQVLAPDPNTNPFGAVMSNAGEGQIGQ